MGEREKQKAVRHFFTVKNAEEGRKDGKQEAGRRKRSL